MTKNLLKVVFLLMFLPQTAFLQEHKIYLISHVGAGLHVFEPGLLNDFATSYNKHFDNGNLEKEMDLFESRMNGISRGIGVYGISNSFVWAFDYTKSTYSQTISSRFKSQAGQQIDLRFVDWDYNFELGFKLHKGFLFSGLFGFGIRDASIDSRTVYFDGVSKSNGNEFPLNGVYRPIIMSKFNYGVSLKIQLMKYLDLQVRAYNNIIPFGEQDNLTAFEDKSAGKRLTATYFPHNTTKFYQDWQSGVRDSQNNVIPFDFTGWQLSVSLIAKLNLYNE